MLEQHDPDCMLHKPCKIRFPSSKKPRKPDNPFGGDGLDELEDPESLEEHLGIDKDVRHILRGEQDDEVVDEEIKAVVQQRMMDEDECNSKKLPENIMRFTQYKNCYKN